MADWRTIRRSAALLVQAAPRPLALLAAVHVVEGMTAAAVLAAGATLLDRAPAAATSGPARTATVAAMVVIGAVLALRQAAASVRSMLHALVELRFRAAVDRVRMEAATRLPGLAHFDDPATADALQASRWAADASRLVSLAGYLLQWVVQAASAAAVAARLGWWVPAVPILAALPGAVLAWRQAGARKARQSAGVAAVRRSRYGAELAVGAEVAGELRLFGVGDWLRARQRRSWEEAVGPVLAGMRADARRGLAAGLALAAVSAVPLAAAYRRLASGEVTAGDFSAGVLALAALMAALQILREFPAEVRGAAGFLPDLWAVADLPARDPRLVADGYRPPPLAPATGIRFEGVRFAYPGSRRPVLEGLDLWLPAGSSLALVGENGAGKSTVVKLLCRFYDPDEGRITVDGVDLRELDLVAWRARLAVAFQEPFRLPLPAADNVGVGCVARAGDRTLLDDAAAQAGAGPMIERLPQGWETVLSRPFGGVDLSGGEWQRIVLARTLAARLGRDASVLVLDEPTAALDARVEHDLYQRFARLTAGLTTLVVSHRFSTVRMTAAVAVLDGGRAVEVGTHDQLVAAGGRYAALFGLAARRYS